MPSPTSPAPSSESSDSDSMSGMEVITSPVKVKEEVARALEEEQKTAADNGDPTYGDGSALQIGYNGRVRSARMVRRERVRKARQTVKARVMQLVVKAMKEPHVRDTVRNFRREIKGDQRPDGKKIKILVSADEDKMCLHSMT